MKIGYIRVSTAEQNTARQEVLMVELGVATVKLKPLLILGKIKYSYARINNGLT